MRDPLLSPSSTALAPARHRPIYFFDIVHDFPEIGGVVDVSKALMRALAQRFGTRLRSARDAAARLGGLDRKAGYFDRERIAAETIARHDPRSIFVFPNFQSPIARRPGGPAVLNLVHDLQFAALPELFSAEDRAWLDEAFAAARANADQLVFVSKATRDDYVARFGLPRAEAVIHPPVTAGVTTAETRENYLLACAHYDNHPHKNFAGLVALFAALAPRVDGLRLVVTGHGREGFLRELGRLAPEIRDRIAHLGYVPRAELDGLQARARALVSLSHFEGFNLPAAEAALRGTPLILSDLPAHRELHGDRACLVDARDPSLDAVLHFLARRPTVAPWPLVDACRPEAVADAFEAIVARLDRSASAAMPRIQRRVRHSAWLARLLLSGTILSGSVAVAAAAELPVYTPSGGAGGLSTTGFGGGPGGSGIGANGTAGNPATINNGGGGGGGGGGAFNAGTGKGGDGGNGMSGGAPVLGGPGGQTAGAMGMDGGGQSNLNSSGGGGGGGGAGGAIALQGTAITNTTALTAGNGGAGGAGGIGQNLEFGATGAGGNGGGGAGGLGIYVTGGGAAGSNSANVMGGNGGMGGSNITQIGENMVSGGGGGGGDGGAGVYSLSTGTFTNSNLGSITGGSGGGGGNAVNQASGGNGGNGAPGFVLSGAGGTLMNLGGAITGGQAGERGTGAMNSYYGTRGTSGDGVVFTTPGTLVNTGMISGARGLTSRNNFPYNTIPSGDGGRGVVIYSGATIDNSGGLILGGNAGTAIETASGAGGIGLVGTDITLTNTRGTVAGGFDYSGANQSAAIVLTGGFNQIGTGGEISGGINVTGTSIFQAALSTSTPGTPLMVTGPLNFDPTSTYQVRITPMASDSVRVNAMQTDGVNEQNGTATLNGAAIKVVAGTGTYQAKTYTILTAENGVTGKFNPNVNTNLVFLNPSLSYNTNNVFLTIAPTNGVVANNGTTLVPDYRYAALTLNQLAVASGLTNAAKINSGTGPILTAFNQLTLQQARAAFDSLSGEGITGAQNLAHQAGELFTSTIFDQTTFYGAGNAANSVTLTEPLPGFVALAAAQGQPIRELADLPASRTPPVFVAPNRTWRAWATGYGGVEDIHGNALPIGSATQNNTLYGGALGVDYQLTPNYLVGVALGGSDGDFRVANRGTSGSSTGGQIAFYDIYSLGAWYGASSTAFEYYTNRSTRFVSGFGGLGSETLRGAFDSHEFRSRLEVGRHFDGFGGTLTPFVALEIADLRSNGFGETPITGRGLFRLNIDGQSTADVPAFVGVRLQRVTPLGNGMVLSPTLQVAYEHDFAPYRSQIGTLADLPGATFLVDGARPSRDAAQVKAGAQLAITAHAALFANFEGEFSGVEQFYAGKGGFKYVW